MILTCRATVSRAARRQVWRPPSRTFVQSRASISSPPWPAPGSVSCWPCTVWTVWDRARRAPGWARAVEIGRPVWASGCRWGGRGRGTRASRPTRISWSRPTGRPAWSRPWETCEAPVPRPWTSAAPGTPLRRTDSPPGKRQIETDFLVRKGQRPGQFERPSPE